MKDIESLILLITLCIVSVVLVCVLVCVLSINFFIYALKSNAKKSLKRKRLTSKSLINNGNNAFVCRHINCNRAPKSEKDNSPSQNIQNQNRHECAQLDDHNDCISNDCGFCLQLLRMSLKEYRSLVSSKHIKHDRDDLMLRLKELDSCKKRKNNNSDSPYTTPRRSTRTRSLSSNTPSYTSVSYEGTRSTSSASSASNNNNDFDLLAPSATRSGGRREHALKTQLDDSNDVLKALLDFLEQLPLVSPFRWQIQGNMAVNLSVSKIANFFKIPYHRVYNAARKVADDLDESIRWLRLPGLKREHWREEVIEEAKKHWYECSRQTTRRDEEGNRIDEYFDKISLKQDPYMQRLLKHLLKIQNTIGRIWLQLSATFGDSIAERKIF